MESESDGLSKNLLVFFIVFVFLNLLVLDFFVFFKDKTKTVRTEREKEELLSQRDIFPDQFCPQSCLTTIKEATSSLTLTSPTPVKAISGQSVSQVKEFYAPIGAGKTTASDWEDIAGLQVYIDTTKYEKIKAAYFEASIRVPTKNQWVDVRLYNVTDKHPVWFSEVRFPGGSDPTLLVSEPIVLEPGNKLYQVQMKTQLKHEAFLDQSRVRILSE